MYTAHLMLCTLHTSCYVCCTPHVMYTAHLMLCTLHTSCYVHCIPHAMYTAHLMLCTLHTSCYVHCTPHAMYTAHLMLYTLHTSCYVHCTPHAMYTAHLIGVLSHTNHTALFFLFLHAACTAYLSSCSPQCLHCTAPLCYLHSTSLLLPHATYTLNLPFCSLMLPTQHISSFAASCYLHSKPPLLLPHATNTVHLPFCSLMISTLCCAPSCYLHYTSPSAPTCYLHYALFPHATYTTPPSTP